MVACCMVKCSKRSGRDPGIRFFSIPAVITGQCDKTKTLSTERRRLWLKRINRPDLQDENIARWTKVCSLHFISGKPSSLFEYASPDWVPSINLGYELPGSETLKLNNAVERFNRFMRRNLAIKSKEVTKKIKSEEVTFTNNLKSEEVTFSNHLKSEEVTFTNNLKSEEVTFTNNLKSEAYVQTDLASNNIFSTEEVFSLQKSLEITEADNVALRSEVFKLKSQISRMILNEETLRCNDVKVKFYTGIKTYTLLEQAFQQVSPHIQHTLNCCLTKFQEFLVVLLRLHLNLAELDLAYRFNVSQGSISRIISKWSPVVKEHLQINQSKHLQGCVTE